MKWVISTPAAGRPIEYEAILKRHVRLDDEYDAEADLVELYIDAATEYAQERLHSSLMEQTITATFYLDDIHNGVVCLPRGPVIDITSVVDDNGDAATYDEFRVGHSDRLKITSALAAPITVVYQAGYETADEIPADIRLAIMTHVASLFENRESISEKAMVAVPHSLDAFYRLKARSLGVA